ncbi:MAG: hypothetical protein NTU76_02150 [Candidatus Taylorbacteria bacterium]|nr:hypothetical protein [Candidatus Taylorbacteria bacterium]
MKKTKLLPTLLIVSFLSGSVMAIASNVSPSNSTSTKISEEMKAKIEEAKKQIEQDKEILKDLKASSTLNQQQRQQILKDEINKKAEEKINEQREKATERFTDAVNKLEKIIKRVESRIAKLEASSTDMTISKGFLATAKTQMISAKANIEILGNMVVQLNASTTKKISKQNIKDQEKKIKDDLKLVHKSIVNAVESMKPGRPEEKATSTKNKI